MASLCVVAALIARQSSTASHFAQMLEGNGYGLAATHMILASDQLQAAAVVLAEQNGGRLTGGELQEGLIGEATAQFLNLSALRQSCDELASDELAMRL